jgi:hypothetical protein
MDAGVGGLRKARGQRNARCKVRNAHKRSGGRCEDNQSNGLNKKPTKQRNIFMLHISSFSWCIEKSLTLRSRSSQVMEGEVVRLGFWRDWIRCERSNRAPNAPPKCSQDVFKTSV